jgi:hypothetical protein
VGLYLEQNNFIEYLYSIFDEEVVVIVSARFNIGTAKIWNGATIFWQVDNKQKVRSGKIVLYDILTGKRSKKITWVHSVLKLKNYNLKQCFFGAHLVNRPENKGKTIGIVESEKTAIISAGYFPNMIWLASGSAEGINEYKLRALKGRKVILYPDTSTDSKMFNKWEQKAIEFGLEVSTFLEDNTTAEEKAEGLDIADFLIKKPPPVINENENNAIPEQDAYSLFIQELKEDELKANKNKPHTPEKQVFDFSKLKTFFDNNIFSIHTIEVSKGFAVSNMKTFIDSHFRAADKLHFERLQKYKEMYNNGTLKYYRSRFDLPFIKTKKININLKQ